MEGFIFEKCMLIDGNVIGKRKEKKGDRENEEILYKRGV